MATTKLWHISGRLLERKIVELQEAYTLDEEVS